MAYKNIFSRYELKYLITREQKALLLAFMEGFMKPDKYGRSTIRNIYYDTDSFLLIRRSIEKPLYKEKLRVRSYKQVSPEDDVFVEIKKKYKSVVYKRRLVLPEGVVSEAFENGEPLPSNTQIGREIEYFRKYYEDLAPKVFLSYEREAYYSKIDPEFRITFDENILFRTEELSLCSPVYGEGILEDGMVLMEVKTAGGIPMDFSRLLSENKIFKTSFSKYGNAYRKILTEQKERGCIYV